MHHHHNSNFDWQMQQQVQLEQMAVWQLWRNNRQQRQTNDLLAQNNQLLEQIRRNTLTPAQRAAEDHQRALDDAADAAREKENLKLVGLILLVIGLVVLWVTGFAFLSSCIALGAVGIWRLMAQRNKQLGLILLSVSLLGATIFLCIAGGTYARSAAAAQPIQNAVYVAPASTPQATPEATPEPTATPQVNSEADLATLDAPRDHSAPRAQLVRRHSSRHHTAHQ
jgi:hypothetical protein